MGKSHYRALDKMVEDIQETTTAADKLMIRNVLCDMVNEMIRDDMITRRVQLPDIIGKRSRGGQYSVRDLAAGSEAQDRQEQIALEFQRNRDKGAA